MTFCFALFLGLIHKNSRQFWDKSVYFNLFLPKLKKKKTGTKRNASVPNEKII